MPVKECGVCKKALITSVVPKEGLVLEESTKERFLCHPNAIFNQLIQKLNSIFDANKDRLDISVFLVKEAARQKMFRFPCDQHKIEVMAFVVEYFLSIKMRKLCRDINDRLKQNMHKKNCKTLLNKDYVIINYAFLFLNTIVILSILLILDYIITF